MLSFRSLPALCSLAILVGYHGLSPAQTPDAQQTAQGRSLFEQLTTTGVQFPSGMNVVLKPPALNSALATKDRQAVLESLAGGIGWDRFSRNSHVAPIEIDMQYVKNEAGERVGHLVAIAFVAHIELEQLRRPEQLKKVFQLDTDEANANGYHAQEATADQLGKWGITPPQDHTSYLMLEIPLLERVLVKGWLQVQHSEPQDSITLSWLLDPRFASSTNAEEGNQWTPIVNPEKGSTEDEISRPYEGFGGYMRITQLDNPAGASLVETRLVIHEPTDWFRGSNLLRSKLPLMIQESVRTFRRQWSERTP